MQHLKYSFVKRAGTKKIEIELFFFFFSLSFFSYFRAIHIIYFKKDYKKIF